MTTLDRSSRAIENTFVQRLTTLEPGVEKLIASLTGKAVEVIDSKLFETALDEINKGVDWLADTIGKKDFQDKVLALVNGTLSWPRVWGYCWRLGGYGQVVWCRIG